MISKIKNLIENYENIELYFDNDEAGNRAVEMIKMKTKTQKIVGFYIQILKT
ncbi:hypothetical protein EJ377_07740 [Chryseobacterium arthrosphaerae]|uniref:Toprim domain-containing protein n=1 Tax=Chryseobacterium arthrosphaerae TaxID=651561 RepID=A0A432E0P6_9FLAO|nr:hypothetical protein EJ377_07740 [Chryseobacterium arthrosphaerae]